MWLNIIEVSSGILVLSEKNNMENKEQNDIKNKNIDPVCGMQVNSEDFSATCNGNIYYFCSDVCREKFETEPKKYTRK